MIRLWFLFFGRNIRVEHPQPQPGPHTQAIRNPGPGRREPYVNPMLLRLKANQRPAEVLEQAVPATDDYPRWDDTTKRYFRLWTEAWEPGGDSGDEHRERGA